MDSAARWEYSEDWNAAWKGEMPVVGGCCTFNCSLFDGSCAAVTEEVMWELVGGYDVVEGLDVAVGGEVDFPTMEEIGSLSICKAFC